MSRPKVSGYRTQENSLDITKVGKIINDIPRLTKLGGICLVTGKFVGVLAIPAVFIPALNSLAIFLVIAWGGLVFTAIALCSYEHFRDKEIGNNNDKVAVVKQMISENQDLREYLANEIELDNQANEKAPEEYYESRKVVNMNAKIYLRKP